MTRWGNYAIHSDQLNTPRQIANGLGFTVWTLPYSAFGAAQPNSSGLIYNLRFAGQYYDGETGLNQNYFRDYDPNTGRYVESDPIGLAGGTNPYAYVGGDSVNLIDPLALDPYYLGYSPSQIQGLAAQSSANAAVAQASAAVTPQAAITVLNAESTAAGLAAFAFPPFALISTGLSETSAVISYNTTGSVDTFSVITPLLAAGGAELLAPLFTTDENILRAIILGTGTLDTANSALQTAIAYFDAQKCTQSR